MTKINFTIAIFLVLAGLLYFPERARADWLYTVHRGDTLHRIASKTGVTERSLRLRNGLRFRHLRIGQRIFIPSGIANARSRRGGVRNYGEFDLLARVIHAEAGAEPFLGKVAVGGVVLNRTQSAKFPRSIAGVVYQPHAFESVSNGIIYRRASFASKRAARAALAGWDPSGGALYFFNPSKTNNRWLWARRIVNRIGKHFFAI